MPWTLRDLMSEVTSFAKVTDEEIHPSRVSFYINQAQRDVANRVQQLEFERLAVSSTSSGDDKMYLPTDCERVLNLSLETGGGRRVIPQGNIQQVDDKSWGTQGGRPNFYVSYASWLQFYPSPDSSYSLLLRYVARLSDITNLNSIPSIDTRYHQAVLFKAVEYVAMRQQNTALAGQMLGLFEKDLADQPSVTAQRQLNRAGAHCELKLTDVPYDRYDFDRSNR